MTDRQRGRQAPVKIITEGQCVVIVSGQQVVEVCCKDDAVDDPGGVAPAIRAPGVVDLDALDVDWGSPERVLTLRVSD